MAGISSGVEPSGVDPFPDDGGHGIPRQAAYDELAVPVHGPKNWPLIDRGGRFPGIKGSDWTVAGAPERNADLAARPVLIGLGAANVDDHALPDDLQIAVV